MVLVFSYFVIYALLDVFIIYLCVPLLLMLYLFNLFSSVHVFRYGLFRSLFLYICMYVGLYVFISVVISLVRYFVISLCMYICSLMYLCICHLFSSRLSLCIYSCISLSAMYVYSFVCSLYVSLFL